MDSPPSDVGQAFAITVLSAMLGEPFGAVPLELGLLWWPASR